MNWWVIFSILFLFTCQPAQAYIVAVPANQPALDYNKPTHILVPGRGTNLALLPQLAAITRGLLYRRNFPENQVVMISVIENKYNERLLMLAGWKLIVKNDVILETDSVLGEAKKFTQIQSFEMFGHSSAIRGFQMDGDSKTSIRFDPREPAVWDLKDHFAPGAYALLYGCNTGWSIAQMLAKKWNIAVAGTFTESHFEKLNSDGRYYVGDDRQAPRTRWAKNNPRLGGRDCELGGCTRMRPNNKSYAGWWGNFAGPYLTHFKFFCPLDMKDCQKSMAASLYGFASETPLHADANFDQFRYVAKQFLCPVTKDRKLTNDCYNQLDLVEQGIGDRTVNYTGQNKQLVCDFHGCKAKIECNLDDRVHTCTITDRVWENSTTLADEYMHFLNGYKLLFEDKVILQ